MSSVSRSRGVTSVFELAAAIRTGVEFLVPSAIRIGRRFAMRADVSFLGSTFSFLFLAFAFAFGFGRRFFVRRDRCRRRVGPAGSGGSSQSLLNPEHREGDDFTILLSKTKRFLFAHFARKESSDKFIVDRKRLA